MKDFENGTEYREEALKCLISLNTRKLVDSKKIGVFFYPAFSMILKIKHL